MDEEATEVQKLRQKLREALRVLNRHVDAHPENKLTAEYLRLFMKCEKLERQLDQLENQPTAAGSTRAFSSVDIVGKT
jgi:hypothetical protein